MVEVSGHKYTVHKVGAPLGSPEWRVHCVCGWKEKAQNMGDAIVRGRHHQKYPKR